MVEIKEMLLNKIPFASGQFIDSQDMYLAATDVLPYCDSTEGHPSHTITVLRRPVNSVMEALWFTLARTGS